MQREGRLRLLRSKSDPSSPFLFQVLQVAISVLSNLGKYPEALRLALRLQDDEAIAQIMGACKDK